jgi:integrase
LQAFRGIRVADLTSDRIMAYVAGRRAQGLAPASINRDLAALKRMFRLGAQQTPPMVLQIPHIPLLKEDNVRTGFFEHEAFLVLRGVAPDYLKVAISVAYWTGMRRGEILNLLWDQVDLVHRMIRLDPGTTKTGEGRLIPFMGDLDVVLEKWWRHARSVYPSCPWVVHFQGHQVVSLKRAWINTCRLAGFENMRFHDFRRTAVRNMVRAGISDHVAMKISGHRTRAVFDRYDIVSEADLHEAAARLALKMGTMTGTAEVGVCSEMPLSS